VPSYLSQRTPEKPCLNDVSDIGGWRRTALIASVFLVVLTLIPLWDELAEELGVGLVTSFWDTVLTDRIRPWCSSILYWNVASHSGTAVKACAVSWLGEQWYHLCECHEIVLRQPFWPFVNQSIDADDYYQLHTCTHILIIRVQIHTIYPSMSIFKRLGVKPWSQ
jgi:hypothetical protein